MRAVEKLLAGESLSEDAWLVDSASESLIPTSAPGGIFRASVRSSAAMDRGGDGAFAHSTACLEFAPGCGLWFVAVFADDAARQQWRDRLQGAIRLLADSGFGGERSRGWGRAETPEFREGKLDELLTTPPAPGGENVYWLLSLFHPSETDNVDWSQGNYTVTTRVGRIESAAQWGDAKKSSRMVAEGSVLLAHSAPRGSVMDVAPEGFPHPVYRAGLALTIPVPKAVARSGQ
jgi:CRISPR type III-A-associated RAMP protein Csm4